MRPGDRWQSLLAVLVLFIAAAASLYRAGPSPHRSALPPAAEPPLPRPVAAVQAPLDEAAGLLQAKQPRAALKAGDWALVAARHAGDRVGIARAWEARAHAWEALKRQPEAVSAWRTAAKAWAAAGDGPGQVAALSAAALRLVRSDPAEADALVAQALAVGREEPQRPRAAARQMIAAGAAFYDQGRLGVAKQFWTAALALQEKVAPDSMELAETLHLLGGLAKELSDLDAAREYHLRALDIRNRRKAGSLEVAESLHDLGAVAWTHSQWAAARDYLQRALALREKLKPGSLAVAETLRGMGMLVQSLRQPAAAKEKYRRALTIQEKLAPGSLAEASTRMSLGFLLADQGDLAEARAHQQRALAIRRRLAPDSVALVFSLHNLGAMAWEQGQWIEAERLFQESWALVRRRAAAVTGDEALWRYSGSNAFFAAPLLEAQIARGELWPALVTMEESRAQALQQLLLDRRLDISGAPAALKAAHQATAATRDRAEQAASLASQARQLTENRLETLSARRGAAPVALARARADRDAASRQLDAAHAAYTRARVKADQCWAEIRQRARPDVVSPLSLAQAQQALPAGTLFVAFFVTNEQTHLFLLHRTPGGAPVLSVHTLPVAYQALQQQVQQARQELIHPGLISRQRESGGRLFATLFPPKAQPLLQGARRLLISPDGPLWELPFAALPTSGQEEPHYLGLDRPITYTQSLTLFARSRQDRPPARGRRPVALVVGDPIFASRSLRPIAVASASPAGGVDQGELFSLSPDRLPPAPLPETRTEAERIARGYGGSPLLGEQATEAALRQRLGEADVIHLATHSFWNRERPMSSGVLLTVPEPQPPAGKTDNDGALQAWEISSQLRLRAELVVLSACETGRGAPALSEGIIGLTRALQSAGARSIVASQWKVADESTAALMVAFHQKLRQGWAKDEALRQAMASVQQAPRTAHPYYWAPFFLVGDPDNPSLGAEHRPS